MVKQLEKVTSALLEQYTPLQLAAVLPGEDGKQGINHTHVYRARRGDFTRTYVESLQRAGHLPPPAPYPYLKIRKDDAARAAVQIIENLGEGYARLLARELFRKM